MKQESSFIKIERIWAMPNKNTFDIPPIKQLLHEEMLGCEWIDPFAKDSRLAKYGNDINPNTIQLNHLEANDFMKEFNSNSMDGGLLDWVYSPRQLAECYKNIGIPVTGLDTSAQTWRVWRESMARLIKPGGRAITFGWSSAGIGMKYGFTPYRILIVPHGGMHNDTIVTCEIKEKCLS